MSDLRRKVIVRAPASLAPVYLDRFFAEHRDGVPGKLELTLRLAMAIPGLGTDIALERDVLVSIEPRGGELHGRYIAVQWSPMGGGPFPSFTGTLSIEPDQDESLSVLAIDGAYEPPLGMPGRLFDAALGRRIAQATARDLLARIARYIELAHEHS